MKGKKEGKRKGLWWCFFAVPVRGYSWHDRFVSGAHIHSWRLPVISDFQYFNVVQKNLETRHTAQLKCSDKNQWIKKRNDRRTKRTTATTETHVAVHLKPWETLAQLTWVFFRYSFRQRDDIRQKIALFSLVAERENKRAPYMGEIGSSLNNKLLRKIKEILCQLHDTNTLLDPVV